MTEKNETKVEKDNTRAMWIVSVVIVVFLAGAMGANMLFHHDTNPGATDVNSPPPTAPPQ